MKAFRSFFLATALFVTSSVAVSQLQFYDGNYNLTWNYLPETEEVEFKVSVKSRGFVALGITKTNHGMKDLDLFVGSFSWDAGSQIKDYSAFSIGPPAEDAQQDYVLISASQSNGVTKVHCKRKLITNDNMDHKIEAGDSFYFAWSTHPTSDALIYHERRNRGYSEFMYKLVPFVSAPISALPENAPMRPAPYLGDETAMTAGPTQRPTEEQIPTMAMIGPERITGEEPTSRASEASISCSMVLFISALLVAMAAQKNVE